MLNEIFNYFNYATLYRHLQQETIYLQVDAWKLDTSPQLHLHVIDFFICVNMALKIKQNHFQYVHTKSGNEH